MGKRNNAKRQPNVEVVHSLDEFKKVNEKLVSGGYTAMPGMLGAGDGNPAGQMFEDYLSSYMFSDDSNRKYNRNRSLSLLHVSSGQATPVTTAKGYTGKFITWGDGNRIPNAVALLTGMSPYVAAGHKFNTDLCAGMGPQPKYRYVQYVGGNITAKEIPFEHAGVLLQGQIADLQRQLINLEKESPEESPLYIDETTPTENSSASQMKEDLRKQIEELRQKYADWQQVNAEVNTFLKHNNLVQTYLHLNVDMQLLWQCFPEMQLSLYSVNDKGETDIEETTGWKPRVTGLRWRACHQTRKEIMDADGEVRHVFVSNRWLDQPHITPRPNDVDVLPAISETAPIVDLERIVREARDSKLAPADRPTRIVFPVSYPTAGRPYYPIPAWHSIFGGDVYLYATTLISDRAKRRRNANVIGRIIYVNDEYLQRLCIQRHLDTPEQKRQLFKDIVSDINAFLKNRDNMGEPLVAYTFKDSDGKTYESWKIVEIENNNKSTAEANQKELAEVSSIIFFAMGLDSRLVGNTPGDVSNGGGTDLRERYLLKQVQMSPMESIILKPLEVASQFNGWTRANLVWRIRHEVLTTLDNSKTGLRESETD